MLLRSGRRYHPYRQTNRPSYRRSATPARPKRKFRRSGKATTSKYGKATSNNFRTRKVGLFAWRRHLWQGTQFMAHYRSIGQSSTPLSMPVIGTPGTAGVYLGPALSTTTFTSPIIANPFWSSTGGLQGIDNAVPLPTFVGDVTLRGGICRLSLFNQDDVQIRFKVYAFWVIKNPSFRVYTQLSGSSRPVEWDPTSIQEVSTEFGKVLYQKEATIDPGQSMEVVHRFKVQKLDIVRFQGGVSDPAGSTLYWMVSFIPLINNAAAGNCIATSSWNLSFSADVVN